MVIKCVGGGGGGRGQQHQQHILARTLAPDGMVAMGINGNVVWDGVNPTSSLLLDLPHFIYY
jgi:hypothetical protein